MSWIPTPSRFSYYLQLLYVIFSQPIHRTHPNKRKFSYSHFTLLLSIYLICICVCKYIYIYTYTSIYIIHSLPRFSFLSVELVETVGKLVEKPTEFSLDVFIFSSFFFFHLVSLLLHLDCISRSALGETTEKK